jgi:hypothetical protein
MSQELGLEASRISRIDPSQGREDDRQMKKKKMMKKKKK